jgi:hypothetical protein
MSALAFESCLIREDNSAASSILNRVVDILSDRTYGNPRYKYTYTRTEISSLPGVRLYSMLSSLRYKSPFDLSFSVEIK